MWLLFSYFSQAMNLKFVSLSGKILYSYSKIIFQIILNSMEKQKLTRNFLVF